MRSIFVDIYIRAAVKSGLSISNQSLRMTSDHIDRVLASQSERFTEPQNFEKAVSGFLTYVERMINHAKAENSDQLREDDFFAAKKECGIIWWCE